LVEGLLELDDPPWGLVMVQAFRADELCLIESKTATRVVLSEFALKDSSSVSWMLLR
jgi:hypothetical protein